MTVMQRMLSIWILIIGPVSWSHAKSWSDASNSLTFKVGFVTPSLNSDFKPENNSPNKVVFGPSSPTKFTLGIGYGPFSASYGIPSAPTPQAIAEKGESKISDWQFRFFGDVHTFDFFYQKYTGYYIQNTSVVDPSYAGNIVRPDISNENYGVQYFYNFHSNDVSVRAAFEQTSVQNRSGGGGLLVASANHFKTQADSAILPATVSSQYGRFSSLKGGVFSSMRLGAGGVYNFIYGNLFASGLLTIGVGPQSQVFDVGAAELIEDSKTVAGANLKLSLGYNSKSFFTALGLFIDTQNIENENLYVTNSTVEGSIWIGSRF